jgi:hypothetical protein
MYECNHEFSMNTNEGQENKNKRKNQKKSWFFSLASVPRFVISIDFVKYYFLLLTHSYVKYNDYR